MYCLPSSPQGTWSCHAATSGEAHPGRTSSGVSERGHVSTPPPSHHLSAAPHNHSGHWLWENGRGEFLTPHTHKPGSCLFVRLEPQERIDLCIALCADCVSSSFYVGSLWISSLQYTDNMVCLQVSWINCCPVEMHCLLLCLSFYSLKFNRN